MKEKTTIISVIIFGIFFLFGLATLGYLPGSAALKFKSYERTVNVKGLSERVYPADIAIWPIVFNDTNNELDELYKSIENKTNTIINYLKQAGLTDSEISTSPPTITDQYASWYSKDNKPEFRYTASQRLSVYSKNVDLVRQLLGKISTLGKQGILFGSDYQMAPIYSFTRLNEVKPEMIEEATKKAREVALKFAQDSNSRLGKIKQASQGQFSIHDRDQFNQHLKEIRVVSTVEYYLTD